MTLLDVPPPEPNPPKRTVLVFGIIGITIVGISLFVIGLRRGTNGLSEVPAYQDDAGVADGPTGTTTLFFVAEDGMALVEHHQPFDRENGDDSLGHAWTVLNHQLAEAPPPLKSPFPEGTELRAIYLTPDGDAFIDLNREITRGHGGGSLDELLTVYALVNALTANLPGVSAVQILIDGQEVDTLAGHIDLRRPLGQNMKWVSGYTQNSESESTSTGG